MRLQRQPMTTPSGRASGTGLACVGPSVPPVESSQINEANGSCEETDELGFSTFEDATERGIPQRPSCWQEVVRDSVVLTSEQLTRNSSLTRPGYEAIADVVLLTDSDAENLSGLFCHEVTHNTIRSYRKSMAELRHLGHYSERPGTSCRARACRCVLG